MIGRLYSYITILLILVLSSCTNTKTRETIRFIDLDNGIREKNHIQFVSLFPDYAKKIEISIILKFDDRETKTKYSLVYDIRRANKIIQKDTMHIDFGKSYKKPRYKFYSIYNEYNQSIGKYKSPLNGLYTINICPFNGERFSNALMSLGLKIDYISE